MRQPSEPAYGAAAKRLIPSVNERLYGSRKNEPPPLDVPDQCPRCGKRKPFLGPGHANRCGAPEPKGFGP